EGTYFYGSPKRPSRLALTQLLAGGHEGMVFRARNDSLSIGREGNDVNFPDDPFISGRHATVTALDAEGGKFQIADLASKNGTFLRVSGEAPLFHGDYVFLGQQLLRVEIT
ncbi:MAG: FHA domain-containing protein, partial [Polyangia bacterium]